jgi:RNA 2',3'-cyclic 3'-phosphodiesterase
VRLFLAIELDASARREIAAAIEQVRNACGDAADAFRWSVADNTHLTLHFLGSVEPAGLPGLVAALGETLALPSFTASSGAVGTFPPHGAPRTIWLGVEHSRDLLAQIHAELAARLISAGHAVESRPFTPHLTLARARDGARSRARSAQTRLQAVEVGAIAWPVARVVLFESDLSGPRPRYREVHTVSLDQGSPTRTT